MKKMLTGLLLILLSGCGADALPEVDETRANSAAQQALADWINSGPADVDQIEGAVLDSVSVDGDVIHVILVKDNSSFDSQGNGATHMAYFNVYLDLDYQVDKVERGPDMIE